MPMIRTAEVLDHKDLTYKAEFKNIVSIISVYTYTSCHP